MFSRAKRFDYKAPELDVSPADYNITTTFEKGCSIPKCPRFRDTKSKDSSLVCYRLNCCKARDFTSTPYSQKMYNISNPETKIEKTISITRNDFSRNSVRRKSVKSTTIVTPVNHNKNKPSVRGLVQAFEKLGDGDFLENEEFIDDDYHSFTSSEELESLKQIEEFEFNEVCRAFRKLQSEKSLEDRANFERLILEKMENIEQNIKKFSSDFSKMNENMQLQQLQKRHDVEKFKIENLRSHLGSQNYHLSKEQYQEIEKIISKAIQNLSNELEHKRKSVLADSENKIKRLIGELYDSSNMSSREVRQLCKETAMNLSDSLRRILSNTNQPALEFNHCEDIVKEVQKSCMDACFNYENICKVLSEHLQMTQEEKDNLEKSNLDMTLKYGDTQGALQEQASLIDLLHDEIAALKEHVNRKTAIDINYGSKSE